MLRWQYRTVRLAVSPKRETKEGLATADFDAKVDAWLNALGAQGWEIIGPYEDHDHELVAQFKRVAPPGPSGTGSSTWTPPGPSGSA